ncbi:hypothetical protein TrRE_jg3699 [Triparma retinervis]|uniref:Sulfotransferase n=1 Tax=Triparma retinervis TaxID=2557542 RepID=A0A9W7DMJ0_9STRA|nr:hypothetical protein TrRE_jg3699 [Triparma retinervis]
MTELPCAVVLCMSPGRCGTNYLQQLLAVSTGTHSLHEPDPNLACSDCSDAFRAVGAIPEKVAAMLGSLPQGMTTYAETNHCLLHRNWKELIEILVEHIPGRKLGVVVLRRREEDVVSSRLRLGHGTKYTKGGRVHFRGEGWIYYPKERLGPIETADPMQIVCGYVVSVRKNVSEFLRGMW